MFKYDSLYELTRKEKENLLKVITEEELRYPDIGLIGAFEGIKEEGLNAWIEYQNPFDIQSMTAFFKAAYRKELDENETIELQNLGKKAFTEMIKRGLNKEQIRLMLLKEEKAWTTELVSQAKNQPKERDNPIIEDGKTRLKEIYGFTRDLEKIPSPYDNLFNISTQIAELKRENDKIVNNQNSNDLDFKQYDTNQDRIFELEQKLAKETAKYDPRIIEDAINDKISSAELELEIDQIKKGKEVSKEVGRAMPKEIVDLKNDLLAVRKQVKNDIKIVEQNTEHNV